MPSSWQQLRAAATVLAAQRANVAPAPIPFIAGSLGFISFNDTFDLNIVIRTAVLLGDKLTIGAGGAIVVQSGAWGRGVGGAEG